MKNFNFVGADSKVCEFTFETGRLDDVIVNPMIISTTRLAKEDAVILKTVLVEPLLRDFAVFFGTGGKEGDDVAFVVPFVADFQCIRVRLDDGHALGFFVRHIVANRSINVNHEILLVIRQFGADVFSFFVEGLQQIGLFVIMHSERIEM